MRWEPGDVEPAEHEALAAALAELYRQRDERLRDEWDRSLPLPEVVLDRWERARRLGFGDDASIYNSALVYGDVTVGRRTWIGPSVLLDGSGGPLRIGAYCSISAGVQIYTHDTVCWSLSLGEADRATASVSIGDGCHLGALSVVAAGSSIGDRCVVGAHSFVKGHVPDRAVVVGAPARVVGMVRGDGADVEVWTGPDAVEALLGGGAA
jgi:acetyltransferase-like isoleucine patch superfamily enzyme